MHLEEFGFVLMKRLYQIEKLRESNVPSAAKTITESAIANSTSGSVNPLRVCFLIVNFLNSVPIYSV